MQPTEIARTICEDVYGKGKTELLSQLLADGFIGHDPIMGRMDRVALENEVKAYRRAFPDLTMEVLDLFHSGDKTIVRWKAMGTHKGELFGTQPTNRRVTIEGMSEAKIANGKVQESWDQWDAFGLFRQIGAVPELKIPRVDGGGRPEQQARR